MEGNCLLDMDVPVGPVMFAGELFILVPITQRLQMRVKCAIGVEQEILGSAVYPKRGALRFRQSLRQRKTVLRAAHRILSHHADKFGIESIVPAGFGNGSKVSEA